MRSWWLAVCGSLALAACGDDDEAPRGAAGGTDSGQAGQATAGASGSMPSSAGSAGQPVAASGTGGQGEIAGGSGGGAGEGGAPGLVPCALIDSEPVAASEDGQLIENLHIVASGQPGISVEGFTGVMIRNVWIEHSGAPGIAFSGAADIRIESAVIEHTGAPESGANVSEDLNNIDGYDSERVQVDKVRLTRGSSGIYLVECPDSTLSFVEGYDFRGPFPRGQLVQFNNSHRSKLEDFSVINPPGSWPEDNVNVYQTQDAEVRRGHIDGNNSPAGVGVIFDGDTSTGLVEDVDAIHMGNGCFSGYAGEADVTFRRTGCRDNICESQDGRGVPLSGALMWSGNTLHTTQRIEASYYAAPCNPDNIVWPEESFAVIEVVEMDFTPRAPLAQLFCWE